MRILSPEIRWLQLQYKKVTENNILHWLYENIFQPIQQVYDIPVLLLLLFLDIAVLNGLR
jgi:hypothetical protein